MNALQIFRYGDLQTSVGFAEADTPSPGDSQVLIKAHAASANPIDHKIVQGMLKPVMKLPLPVTFGFDVSGVVAECGANVDSFEAGDEVFSRVPTAQMGTFAEYVAVDESAVAPKPHNISYTEAASLPLVGLTTVQCFQHAGLKAGDKVLIHAGSGGVGSFAVQYAAAMGAHVVATAGTANVDWVSGLGANRVIDYKQQDYREIAQDLDVVFDTLGDQYTQDAFSVVHPDGHVVSIAGEMDDETARQLGLNRLIRAVLYARRRKVAKLAARRPAHYRYVFMTANGQQLAGIAELIEQNRIQPQIDSVYPFDQAIEALQHQQDGHARGKVVIEM